MVVIFHARLPMPGGFTGVDVFFVISGFVITAMLAREWQAEGRIRLRRFYARGTCGSRRRWRWRSPSCLASSCAEPLWTAAGDRGNR
jgi:hypothetical protein